MYNNPKHRDSFQRAPFFHGTICVKATVDVGLAVDTCFLAALLNSLIMDSFNRVRLYWVLEE
jgi:hypothetical protein